MATDRSTDIRELFNFAAQTVANGYKKDVVKALSALLAQKPRTLRRWRQTNRAPRWARIQLTWLAYGIPVVGLPGDEEWADWRFRRERVREPDPARGRTASGRPRMRERYRLVLQGPTGRGFTIEELTWYRARLAQLEALQHQVDQVRTWPGERERIRGEISSGVENLVAAAMGLRQALRSPMAWPSSQTPQLELLAA